MAIVLPEKKALVLNLRDPAKVAAHLPHKTLTVDGTDYIAVPHTAEVYRVLRNMGISREISEIALNHVLKGVEGIYDVREEIPERRVALERWAEFIARCEAAANRPQCVLAA